MTCPLPSLLRPLLFGVALALPAAAQQTITLYFDSSYSGAQITLPLPAAGVPLVIPAPFNDQVTSIRWNLDPNTVLYFYENSNLTGREYCVTHDRPRVGGTSNLGSYYNDKLSSLRWFNVNAAQGWVRFFTNTSKGGYQLTRYLSQLGGTEIPLISLGYNDQVDSIEWGLPPSKTVMCYDENPAGGKALPLIDSGYYANLDSGLFGLYHDNLSTCRVMDGQFTSELADRNRPLDQVCLLGSHNSHVNSDQGWVFWIQQNWSILKQLDYGVRSINIDVRHENGQFLMVHGSLSASIAARAGAYPLPVDAELHAIRNWLLAHPQEVIFIHFQNDAGTAFSNWLDGHAIAQFFYQPSKLHWPSINELVALGKRVIVTDSTSSGSQLYPWSWEVENGYSDLWTSAPRSESEAIDGKHRSLFLMNNISSYDSVIAWAGNSPNDKAPLLAHALSFAQKPNIIQIDGVEMADHGGLEVCRTINQLTQSQLPKAAAYRWWGNCSGATTLQPSTTPKIGTTFLLRGAPFHVLAVGFSDVDAGGVALPTAVPGFTLCRLRTSLDLLALANSVGDSSLAIPADTSMLGDRFFCQAVELTGASWPLSNGVAARIGL